MKITDVRVRKFRFPPRKTRRKTVFNAILMNQPPDNRTKLVIQLVTDEDTTGFWSITPLTRAGSQKIDINREIIERLIKPKIIGEDPLMLEHLWQKMYMGGTRKPIAKGDYISAMSLVDNALWDLIGKILGQPVYKLLGGYVNRIRTYAAGGYYAEGKTIEDLVKEMENHVAEGFTAVKMKVGGWRYGITMKTDIERVKAVREALGDNVDIIIDANNAWNAYEARRFIKLIEKYSPFWFEEPVNPDDLDGSIEVKTSTTVPVAQGESEFTRYGYRELISRRAADIIQADPNIAGGLTEIRKIAAMADAHHIQFAPHGNHIIGSHAVAAFPNGLIVESYASKYSPYREMDLPKVISENLLEIKDGFVKIPEKPGFGMKINENSAEKFEIRN